MDPETPPSPDRDKTPEPEQSGGLKKFWAELRRRKVLRAASIYIVAAWVAVQVSSLFFPAIDVPSSALRYVWLTALFNFPLVVVFAWYYDLSLDGIRRTEKRDPGTTFDPSLRRADFIIIAVLAIIAVSLTLQFSFQIERGEASFDNTIEDFSIAVLPFDDLSGNPDEQYFAGGIQGSLIAGLSRIRALRVTSKISTLSFQDTAILLQDVATRLRVARIIEGQVFRNGNQVSVSVQLLDARRDEHIWSATFEDDLGNIMFLMNRMSQEIANQIRVKLGPAEREAFRRAQPVAPEAYLAFLRGEFHVERFNPEDFAIAEVHFQRAVDIDSEYALGYWGLSKLCVFQAQASMITPTEAHERCEPLTDRALELDPFLPEGYFGRAAIATWQRYDWDEARKNFERAIELNPSYAEAHMFYAHFLGIVGELQKSNEHAEIAMRLDPFNPFFHGLYSVQILMSNDYERAIAEAEHALAMAPGYAFGYVVLMRAHAALGNEDEAVEACANLWRHVGGNPDAAEMLEAAYEDLGYEGSMLAVGDAMVELSEQQHVSAVWIAVLHALGGDNEKAIDWLEYAYERSDPDIPYQGANFKNPEIRKHPRYQALLRNLGLDYWIDNP